MPIEMLIFASFLMDEVIFSVLPFLVNRILFFSEVSMEQKLSDPYQYLHNAFSPQSAGIMFHKDRSGTWSKWYTPPPSAVPQRVFCSLARRRLIRVMLRRRPKAGEIPDQPGDPGRSLAASSAHSLARPWARPYPLCHVYRLLAPLPRHGRRQLPFTAQ